MGKDANSVGRCKLAAAVALTALLVAPAPLSHAVPQPPPDPVIDRENDRRHHQPPPSPPPPPPLAPPGATP